MTTSDSTTNGHVLLLAERLRVEERLLIEAFTDAGWQARLITPEETASWVMEHQQVAGEHESLSRARRGIRLYDNADANGRGAIHRTRSDHSVNGNGRQQTIVISRLAAGRDAVALLSLLDDVGYQTINSLELTGMLASRDQLIRGLARRGITSSVATFAFGAEGVLQAAEQAGYPVMLLPINGDEPGILVEDRESAEAVIEHRIVLGRRRAMLVRPELPDVPKRQVVIAGDETFVTATRNGQDWQPAEHLSPDDIELATKLREALGSGVYVAEVADTESARLLLDVKPLNGFRTIHNAGLDVAGAFVRLVKNRANGQSNA